MSGPEDPAARLARVRELFAAEQSKIKNVHVDADGRITDPPPVEVPSAGPQTPVRRLPAPNPAIGTSAAGDSAVDPDTGADVRPPGTGPAPNNGGELLRRFRELRTAEGQRRVQVRNHHLNSRR